MAKVQLIGSREKEGLILRLFISLVVATLTDPIRLQLNVKPPLLAALASLHLLGGKRLVKLYLDCEVLFVQRGLLVVACKLRDRLVEFAWGTSFWRASSAGAADRVACEAWASSGATTSR